MRPVRGPVVPQCRPVSPSAATAAAAVASSAGPSSSSGPAGEGESTASPEPRPPRPAARPPLPRGRRRAFAVLTVLLPLLLLAGLEGVLRLAGFGASYPLFVPSERAPGYLEANRHAVRRFIVHEEAMPNLWIRPVPFERDKPPGALRIFVQGGSTAEGYPYGYGASPAGMLQQRLQRTFPERRVEVVTTAMSAMTTYALLDFADEILEREPDAVVVYAGHNEYLGILGVGSAFSAGRHRPLVLAYLATDELRLVQLVRRLLPDPPSSPAVADGRRTLMERVVAEDRIPYGSRLYRRGLAQYEANLRALLRRYREAGVPVYVGTVVSNERDRRPFVAGHSPGADVAAWRRHAADGEAALAEDDPAVALGAFDAAVAVDDLHAGGHFGRGRALEALGRHAEARRAYLAAKDRDELRFRAPEAINRILRRVAAGEGARVVDVEAAFRRAARHGIVGADLMLEHLHPNVDGYFLMANAFYEAMREAGAFGGSWESAVPRERARREMPVTEVDRLYGEHRIRRLTAGWPFTSEPGDARVPQPENPVERIARDYYRGSYTWPTAMRRLLDYHRSRGHIEEAARVAVLLAEAFPYREEDQLAAAALLERMGRSDAEVYRGRARGIARLSPRGYRATLE